MPTPAPSTMQIPKSAEERAESAYQKALETAAAFKRLGVALDTIAAGTGLSREEIEKL